MNFDYEQKMDIVKKYNEGESLYTLKQMYGTSASVIKTILEKEGVNIRRGVESRKYSLERREETNRKKIGVNFPMQNEAIQEKVAITKEKNFNETEIIPGVKMKDIGLSNIGEIEKHFLEGKISIDQQSSLSEILFLIRLVKQGVSFQMQKQVKGFNYDFYLPAYNLLVEINFFKTHGGEPFDENNPEHVARIQKLLNNNSKNTNKLITIWADKDVRKKNLAKQRGYNFVALYNDSEVDTFFQTYFHEV